jgi:hypothetical protein
MHNGDAQPVTDFPVPPHIHRPAQAGSDDQSGVVALAALIVSFAALGVAAYALIRNGGLPPLPRLMVAVARPVPRAPAGL